VNTVVQFNVLMFLWVCFEKGYLMC